MSGTPIHEPAVFHNQNLLLKFPARSRFLHEESFPAYGIPSGAVHQRGEEVESTAHRKMPRERKVVDPHRRLW